MITLTSSRVSSRSRFVAHRSRRWYSLISAWRAACSTAGWKLTSRRVSGVSNQRTIRTRPNGELRNAFFESRMFHREVSRERIRSANSSLKPREPSGSSIRFLTSALNSRSLFAPSSARSRATRRMSAMIFSTSGLGGDGAFCEVPFSVFSLAMEIAIVLLRARPRGGTLLGAEGTSGFGGGGSPGGSRRDEAQAQLARERSGVAGFPSPESDPFRERAAPRGDARREPERADRPLQARFRNRRR